MASPQTEQLVIGTLIQNPHLLLQSDKYQITINDFSTQLYKYIFWAISNIGPEASGALTIVEIERWLNQNSAGFAEYNRTNGRQVLMDVEGTTASGFDALYSDFKKENLILDLQKNGYNTKDIYTDKVITENDRKVNDYYTSANTDIILNDIEKKFIQLKSKYMRGDSSESQMLAEGLEELLSDLEDCPEIGMPLQGSLFNHIVSGAIPGRFYLRSGSSGLGKTRTMMGDACYLAFPITYDWGKNKWINKGQSEKVMVIITEQNFDEVRKMAIAYITGINEATIKRNQCTPQQKKILAVALEIFKQFQENFRVVRMPSPTLSLIRQTVREHVALYGTAYVFYDYIFISPSLLNEFKGVALRNDEILLMFSDCLKQLAVELDIFVMSATQVNAKADNSEEIRNESSIAGSRAVINKADVGCIMMRPTQAELTTLSNDGISSLDIPNVVTDIYKLRGGENTMVRIWSQIDLGTLRRRDLFVTDASMKVVDIGYEQRVVIPDYVDEWVIDFLAQKNGKG